MSKYKYFDENFKMMKDSIMECIDIMQSKGASDEEVMNVFTAVTIEIYADFNDL